MRINSTKKDRAHDNFYTQISNLSFCMSFVSSVKADPAPTRRPPPLPLFKFIFEFVFVTFDCITRIYFNCSHHKMFRICPLFSTLTTKHRVCVKGASKQTSDPKNSTAPGPRPRFWNSWIRHWSYIALNTYGYSYIWSSHTRDSYLLITFKTTIIKNLQKLCGGISFMTTMNTVFSKFMKSL